ncbi:MAG: NAD-dependent dihydropyrimidine dehydrogenase subunit PreA [Thermodesulfobacteriota bacterium]
MASKGGIDLTVDFCGLEFKNPFLLASAPPTGTGEMMARGYRAGWAGGVTKTLVTDAASIVNVTPRLASLSFPGKARRVYALENIELVTDRPLDDWLRDIEMLRKKHPDHVTIASIMDDASRPEGWEKLARKCEAAGAHMLELNLSCPHGMPERGMGMAIGQDRKLAARVTKWTVDAVKIPVLAKMTPNITDVAQVARTCLKAGAAGLAAINTVAAITGVDLDTFSPLPSVDGRSTAGGLSGLAIKPIALRIVAAIAQATGAPVSGLGGISQWEDAAEFILLGAGTVQVCTAVMANGYGIVDKLISGLGQYLKAKGLPSVQDLTGLALPRLVGHEALSRETRLVSKIDPQLCVKCGACHVSCRDAGYQAIRLQSDKSPVVNKKKCTGCSLCQHVCPVRGCIALVPYREARKK